MPTENTTCERDTQFPRTGSLQIAAAPARLSLGLTLEFCISIARRWFRSTDPALGWCGEIDAAAYMPAAIFQPRHFLNLVAYAKLTLATYVSPNKRATPLRLGQCSGIGYSKYNGQLTDVSWFGRKTSYGRFGRMMGTVCAVQCNCNFRSNGPGALPACIDSPDDPSARTSGQFCSLCGPSTACGSAGCTDDGNIKRAHPIHLYNKGPAECQPRGSPCPPASGH